MMIEEVERENKELKAKNSLLQEELDGIKVLILDNAGKKEKSGQ